MEIDHQWTGSDVNPPMQGVKPTDSAVLYLHYMEKLFSDDKSLILEGIKQIENVVIGNNKQKSNLIQLGVVPKIVDLLQKDNMDMHIKTQCVIVLGSLAKGVESNVKSLLDCGVLEILFFGLFQTDLKFYEACLRCIRTIVMTSSVSADIVFIDVTIVSKILENMNRSICTQECTCEIMQSCCKTRIQQDILYDLGFLNYIQPLLKSGIERIQLKAIVALSLLCYKNIGISHCLCDTSGKSDAKLVIEFLVQCLSRSQSIDIQLNGAKCLTYIYRCGAMSSKQDILTIHKKVLPCLVRMCDSNQSTKNRIVGAKALAYLVEEEPQLQRLCLICEQFSRKLEAYLKQPLSILKRNDATSLEENDIYEAAFLAYAALLSNDEDMRKLVTTASLVQHLVDALSCVYQPVRFAALKCLLSLSRSVQILRTLFEDAIVWKPVLKIAQESELPEGVVLLDDEKIVVSALVCNLILEFSPCKTQFLDANILHTLKTWCADTNNLDLCRNGIWGFLNITFQADIKVIMEVMNILSSDLLFLLLTSDDYDIITKTLGVLNNALTKPEHTDRVMALHGDMIIQACAITFESMAQPIPTPMSSLGNRNVTHAIQTYALCVLGCVAAGDSLTTVNKYLQDNDHFLKKLVEFIKQPDLELQTAAVSCITTLCQRNQVGLLDRQQKFRELGLVDVLYDLKATCGIPLYDRIKKLIEILMDN